jgi:HEAT repeat protein
VAKGATPEVLAGLKGEDEWVRYRAPKAQVRIGADPAVAIPALATAVKDKDVGPAAAAALGHFGKGAVPVLIAALKSGDAGLRAAAAEGLAAVGPDAREAVPALEAAVKDGDEWARVHAGLALWKVAGRKEEAIRLLKARLADEDTQEDAAEKLGSMGAGAKAALPDLTKLLKGPDSSVRVAAALAVWRITGEAGVVVPMLVESARCEHGEIAEEALTALGEMGPAAKAAVPALLELRKAEQDSQPIHLQANDPWKWSKAWETVKRAEEALRRIDPAAAAKAGVR